MSDNMLHRVARAIMEAGTGCEVTDWREAEWNPRIAQVIKEARAAIDVTTDEIVSRLERLIEERRKVNPKRVHGNEYIASCAGFIRQFIDAALSQDTHSLPPPQAQAATNPPNESYQASAGQPAGVFPSAPAGTNSEAQP